MTERQIIALAASVAVAIGLADLPYGYYTLLRITLCGFCLYLLFGDKPIEVEWQRWVTGGFAVLYNPLVPVRIGEKGLWVVLNLLTLAWLWLLTTRHGSHGRAS